MKKERFDEIIRCNLEARFGKSDLGYVVKADENNYRKYENYYTARAFNDFIWEMPKSFFTSYNHGKGSELIIQSGRYGMMPPKMASVASSSRFCYLALKDGPEALGGSGDVRVEYGCKIKGIDEGTPPQLDAFIPEGNVFVEAKCHEIFDSHKIIMKIKYWEHIYGEDNLFGFPVATEKPNVESFEIPVAELGITAERFGKDYNTTMFDIKQFLCHLLGIASERERLGIPKNEEVKFVYLFFKPKTDNEETNTEINKVFDDLQKEIKAIFTSELIVNFTKANKIKLYAVAEYDYVMCHITSGNIRLLFA